MPECSSLAKCPFFNDRMQAIPAMTQVYKTKYCLDNFEQCARFMVSKSLGRESVPVDLYPNQIEIAKKLMEAPH